MHHINIWCPRNIKISSIVHADYFFTDIGVGPPDPIATAIREWPKYSHPCKAPSHPTLCYCDTTVNSGHPSVHRPHASGRLFSARTKTLPTSIAQIPLTDNYTTAPRIKILVPSNFPWLLTLYANDSSTVIDAYPQTHFNRNSKKWTQNSVCSLNPTTWTVTAPNYQPVFPQHPKPYSNRWKAIIPNDPPDPHASGGFF